MKLLDDVIQGAIDDGLDVEVMARRATEDPTRRNIMVGKIFEKKNEEKVCRSQNCWNKRASKLCSSELILSVLWVKMNPFLIVESNR